MSIPILVFIMPMVFSNPTAKCPPVKDEECDSETQLLCKGGIDSYTGCEWPSYCMSIESPDGVKDFDGNICRRTSCPIDCDWEKEIMCPNPPSKNGCDPGFYCMPSSKDENGCPATCPVDCGDGSDGTVKCPGGINWDGCPMSDMCHFGYYNEKTGGICPGYCSANCKEGEQWCMGGIDKDGCPTGDYCATECAKDN